MARAPAAQAYLTASETACHVPDSTPKPAANASPAAVESTASTSKLGISFAFAVRPAEHRPLAPQRNDGVRVPISCNRFAARSSRPRDSQSRMPVRAAASVSFGQATSTAEQLGGNEPEPGGIEDHERVVFAGQFDCAQHRFQRNFQLKQKHVGLPQSNPTAAVTSSAVSRPLAPGITVIAFSPLSSTATIARPLAIWA